MKPILFLIIFFGHLTLQAQDIPKDINLSKLSEAIGHNIAKSLKESLSSIDITKVCQGIQDEVAGKPSPLSDEEFQNQMLLLQTQVFLESAKTNLDEANAFLLKNSKEKGVQEIIPQKLQYKIIKEGNGPFIKEHSNPSITYQGTFVDGTVFGSSVDEEPVTLSLDQTIPGFSKGLVGAKEGEQRILYVHPDLAYGTSGQLPPNKALIFTIDVIKADESEDKSEK